MNQLLRAFVRTKHLTSQDIAETQLHRRLTTLDLTALGVGSTLGAGVYVVTGEVARTQTGPAIVLSFTIAAIASILSALCYAEFGARVPKAGSAYIYGYVAIGELCAFVIGWNLVLEYIVASSSVARAWSAFLDSLMDNHIRDSILSTFGRIRVPWLSEYPDFLAFSFVIVLTVVLICGAKESSIFVWLFTVMNIGVIVFITIAGLIFADVKNWSNFMPFGFHGTMTGAATCFYSFIGFDIVAASGEEMKTPSKSMPRAIIGSLLICFLAYFGVSMALTLMVPYNHLTKNTALAAAFEQRGFSFGKYVVATGAICGLSSSALSSLFPLPRILYAMGNDGVIFGLFAKVNERTGTPIFSCVISGLISAILALLLDLVALVEMLSIGTLLAYTIVAISVLLLRYKPGGLEVLNAEDTSSKEDNKSENECKRSKESDENDLVTGCGSGLFESQQDQDVISPGKTTNGDGSKDKDVANGGHQTEASDNKDNITTPTFRSQHVMDDLKKDLSANTATWTSSFSKALVGGLLKWPTKETYSVVKVSLGCYVVVSLAVISCIVWGSDRLSKREPLMVIMFIFLMVTLLIIVELIDRQPQSKSKLMFQVPLVPILPLLAVFVNLSLVLMLSHVTWIRFAIWMTIGMSIYLFYGIKHSKENKVYSSDDHRGYVKLINHSQDNH